MAIVGCSSDTGSGEKTDGTGAKSQVHDCHLTGHSVRVVAPVSPPVYLSDQVAPLAKVLVLLLVAVCAGCAHVPPYARERLAHPTMQLGEMAAAAEAHVNAVHEGATGGAVGASSGCGCN